MIAPRPVAVLAAALVLLGACGGSGSSSSATTPTGEAVSTAPATAVAASTTAPTTAPPTTEAVTTTTEPLPVPAAPPEPRAPEPRLELGLIEIPKLGLSASLFEGVSLTTLDRGPGHWPGTAMPGHLGNVVIGGHRTSKARPFRYLDRLAPGDEVILSTLEGRFVYRVDRTEIVTPDALWIVDQPRSYNATLFACHPVGSTKERIVVFLTLDRGA